MSRTLKYNYFSTIFEGNILDDNIIHPSVRIVFEEKGSKGVWVRKKDTKK